MMTKSSGPSCSLAKESSTGRQIIRSAPGRSSSVAQSGRSSTTTTLKPQPYARLVTARPTWPAPNITSSGRRPGLDVDRHAAAAGKAVFRSKDEFEIPGSLVLKCCQGSLDGFLLDTPSADSAEKTAVTSYQHLGSCLAGRRTAAGSDCGQCKSLTLAGEPYHLLIQFQIEQWS